MNLLQRKVEQLKDRMNELETLIIIADAAGDGKYELYRAEFDRVKLQHAGMEAAAKAYQEVDPD